MDLQGWVPVEVVCEFKRMRQLNIDEEVVIQVIANVITASLAKTSIIAAF